MIKIQLITFAKSGFFASVSVACFSFRSFAARFLKYVNLSCKLFTSAVLLWQVSLTFMSWISCFNNLEYSSADITIIRRGLLALALVPSCNESPDCDLRQTRQEKIINSTKITLFSLPVNLTFHFHYRSRSTQTIRQFPICGKQDKQIEQKFKFLALVAPLHSHECVCVRLRERENVCINLSV